MNDQSTQCAYLAAKYDRARDLVKLTQQMGRYVDTAQREVAEFAWYKSSVKFTNAERLLTLARLVHVTAASQLAAHVDLFVALVSPDVSADVLNAAQKRAAQAARNCIDALTRRDREWVAFCRKMARRGLWKKPLPKRHPVGLEHERRERHFSRFFSRHGEHATPPPYTESRAIRRYRERRAANGAMTR